MPITKLPVGPRAPARAPVVTCVRGLDSRVLAFASLTSLLGTVAAHAFGFSNPLATIVFAAVLTWITALLTHPRTLPILRAGTISIMAIPHRARIDTDVPSWVLALLSYQDAERYAKEWAAHLHQRVREGEIREARVDRRSL